MEITTQKYGLIFEWYRSPAGYRWLDIEPCDIWKKPFSKWDTEERNTFESMVQRIPHGPFLVELEPTLKPISWAPLSNACLFAEFADEKGDADSLAKWATKNGRLLDINKNTNSYIFIYPEYISSDQTIAGRLRTVGIQFDEKKNSSHYLLRADPLDFWGAEHRDLSFAVLLWELLKNRDTRLTALIQWRDNSREMRIHRTSREQLSKIDFDLFTIDDHYRHACCPAYAVLTNRMGDVDFPWTFRLGTELDCFKAASIYLQGEIERKLTEYPLQLSFFEDSKGSLQKAQQPSSLLSAMWYQLYLAYIGEINLRRCSVCGKWEDMANRRSTWTKHAACANYERVKRARKKQLYKTSPEKNNTDPQ